ncbi:MAG: hypothetical protein RIS64_3262 [Bacteroidota bacterium]|jgi:transcriptional regulator with XRE-family HTH domain
MITIGDKIKFFLKKKNITQAQLAQKLDMTRQRLHSIMQQTFVNDEFADKCAEALDLDKKEFDNFRMNQAENSSPMGNEDQHRFVDSEKELYKQLLASKENEILILRDLVNQLKRQLNQY